MSILTIRGGIGCWFVSDSFTADFRASFDETAVRAGQALNPPRGAKPLEFWLHSLFQSLLKIDEAREDRGHLAVGDKDQPGEYQATRQPHDCLHSIA
jgi:hypothetical protein